MCDVDEGLEVVVLREDRYSVWGEEVFQQTIQLCRGRGRRLLTAVQICPYQAQESVHDGYSLRFFLHSMMVSQTKGRERRLNTPSVWIQNSQRLTSSTSEKEPLERHRDSSLPMGKLHSNNAASTSSPLPLGRSTRSPWPIADCSSRLALSASVITPMSKGLIGRPGRRTFPIGCRS